MEKLSFKIHRPENLEAFPGWVPDMDKLDGSTIEVSPSDISYSFEQSRYHVRHGGWTLAAWWLEQVGNAEKKLFCVRRRKPFTLSCIEHVLKESKVGYYRLQQARVCFISCSNMATKIKGKSFMHRIGRGWGKLKAPPNLHQFQQMVAGAHNAADVQVVLEQLQQEAGDNN